MSRWAELYENHPFQTTWSTLKANLDSAKVDDETVLTSVQELARLKKVISYIDEMLDSIDPELVPSNTWDNFNAQATPCNQQIVNFNSNRDVSHIKIANGNADNLLTYKARCEFFSTRRHSLSVISGKLEPMPCWIGAIRQRK